MNLTINLEVIDKNKEIKELVFTLIRYGFSINKNNTDELKLTLKKSYVYFNKESILFSTMDCYSKRYKYSNKFEKLPNRKQLSNFKYFTQLSSNDKNYFRKLVDPDYKYEGSSFDIDNILDFDITLKNLKESFERIGKSNKTFFSKLDKYKNRR